MGRVARVTPDLSVREAGAGEPIILLHAFPLSSAMWMSQREGLADIARVITPDLRGFGGTPLGHDEPSLDESADDVARLLDTLGLDRVVLGGLSMGGYVSMAFLRRHGDRVKALILADTKAGADPESGAAGRRAMADTLDGDPESTVLVDEVLPKLVGPTTVERRPLVFGRVRGLVQQAPATAAAWVQRAMAARPDSFDTLRAVDVPTLVVVGEEDVLSPPDDAVAMAEAVPDSRLVRIPAAGHLTAVETPEEFNAAVREFLASL
jgi:pimeloyl-ACP methyl ester carboxylesterase